MLRAAIFQRFSRFATSSQFWPCPANCRNFCKFPQFVAVTRNFFCKFSWKWATFIIIFSAVDKHEKCNYATQSIESSCGKKSEAIDMSNLTSVFQALYSSSTHHAYRHVWITSRKMHGRKSWLTRGKESPIIWSEGTPMQIVPQILPCFNISSTRLLALQWSKKLTNPMTLTEYSLFPKSASSQITTSGGWVYDRPTKMAVSNVWHRVESCIVFLV